MRELPAGPIFDRADARALGWSDSALTRAVRAGRVVALRRGQLADPSRLPPSGVAEPVELDRYEVSLALAAARSCRGSVISHRSAALMHCLPALSRRDTLPTLTVPPGSASVLAGANLHRATLPARDVTSCCGVEVTSVARTIVDLGRSLSTAAAVVALDAALHRHLAPRDELNAVLLRCWNWPGIRRAMRVIALADARSESPLESVSRLVIGWLGLPTPMLQPSIYGSDGTFIGRADFYWDEFGVVGEADGAGKYALSATSLLAEKQRQECFEDVGVVVVRWGWSAPTRRPSELRTRLRRAFDRGLVRDRSGLCRQWSIR
jgi:Transcriptional regulator, AbiEi antitoxin